MKSSFLGILVLVGCASSAPPESTMPEAPVLIAAIPPSSSSGLSSQPTPQKSAPVASVQAPVVPKPLSSSPDAVAERMSSALDSAAQQEQRQRDQERAKREADFRRTLDRSKDHDWGTGLGGLTPGGSGLGGVGLGGLGGVRAGGSGYGRAAGLGTGGKKPTPKPKPTTKK